MSSLRMPAAILALVVASSLSALPRTAQADASQLCRSISSLALAPTDLLLAPVIVPKDIHYGLTEQDDPLLLQIIGVLPGALYLSAMQLGGTAVRAIGAIFEFPLGLVNLPREGSPGWLFRAHQDAYALYSEDFGPCPVRVGSSYNSINDF